MAHPKRYPNPEAYHRAVFGREDDLLRNLMPAAVKQGLPNISIFPEAGQMLYMLAKMIGARKILEIGALAGYSGIWLARALPPDGRFLTLELNPKHAEVTRANYVAAGLGDQTEVRVGPALDLLDAVAPEAPFDLVFIDADKETYPRYLDYALEYTRPGGLILADNADAGGHVHEMANQPNGRPNGRLAIQTYNQRIAEHPRLISNIIPVGGWLAVSLVLEKEEN